MRPATRRLLRQRGPGLPLRRDLRPRPRADVGAAAAGSACRRTCRQPRPGAVAAASASDAAGRAAVDPAPARRGSAASRGSRSRTRGSRSPFTTGSAPAEEGARPGSSPPPPRLGPVRLVGGKHVVNLLPAGAPHKGLALERARARLGCDTAIYVGDDETDEDVFALDQPGRLLAIRVGRKPSSSAALLHPGPGARSTACCRCLLASAGEAALVKTRHDASEPSTARRPCRRSARRSSSCGCSGRSTTACRRRSKRMAARSASPVRSGS